MLEVMIKRTLCFMSLMIFTWCAPLQAGEFETQFSALLATHHLRGTIRGIDLSGVNYAAFKSDPRIALAGKALADYDLASLKTEKEKLAFWINAYNFSAIRLVAENWPVKSIKDLGSIFSPVWKKDLGVVAGQHRSLDEIENDILRRDFKEPRIHAAIVCASVSCPDLRGELFVAAKLEEQLTDQMKVFLNNKKKGFAETNAGEATVSPIFKWFASDFEKKSGSVQAFIKQYQPAVLGGTKLGYFEYDWGVNNFVKTP